MGLFGKVSKKIKSGSLFDSFGAAQAILAGDYAGAARLRAHGEERKAEAAKAKQEEEQRRILHATIDADPVLSPEAKVYAKANPKEYIEQYMTRFQQRQFGPGGGSIATPGAGGQTAWQMAPSRHESYGSVFDVSGGDPGQKATVTPQHEGTQWVTPQPGTTAFGVNSFTGARRMGPPPGAPMIGQPPPPQAPPPPDYSAPTPVGTIENGLMFKGGNDEDPANWVPVAQGGAGPRGPNRFPY